MPVSPSSVAKPGPLMPEFLATLREFCRAERGRVNALARHLGVAQPHVSAWLTGRQEPSGENTLRMQQWLAQGAMRTASVSLATRHERRTAKKSRDKERTLPADELPVWLL